MRKIKILDKKLSPAGQKKRQFTYNSGDARNVQHHEFSPRNASRRHQRCCIYSMKTCSTENKHAPNSAAAFAASLIVFGLFATFRQAAADIIPLGQAENITVLANSTVTNAGPTTVTGNVALSSPGVSVTGFPPGTVNNGSIHIGDALANQAHADAANAYNIMVGEASTTNLSGMNLGNMILTPGVYHFDTVAQLTGTLTLDTGGDPNAPFHFQIGTTLTTDPLSAILLLNGGSVNVFWQVGTSATIGVDSVFYGNIIADQSITVNSGATINGRAIAINAAVTLDNNTINAVPEPSTWFAGALVFSIAGFTERRRIRKFIATLR